MQSSTCRSGGVGFQSINQSFNIYMALLQQRRSTFFLLQGFISSPFTKSLNPSDALFKIRNSNKYGNGVPTAKISVGTPFPVVPIGNEPCLQSTISFAGLESTSLINGSSRLNPYNQGLESDYMAQYGPVCASNNRFSN